MIVNAKNIERVIRNGNSGITIIKNNDEPEMYFGLTEVKLSVIFSFPRPRLN
jgi:hypothetical protein